MPCSFGTTLLLLECNVQAGFMGSQAMKYCHMSFCIFFFLVQIEESLAKETRYNQYDKLAQPMWKSRNITHLWPNRTIDNQVTPRNNETYDSPCQKILTHVKQN